MELGYLVMFCAYRLDVTVSEDTAADDICRVLNVQSNIYSSNVMHGGLRCTWMSARVNSERVHDNVTALIVRHIRAVMVYNRSEFGLE